jgi:hypothetical protein
LAATTAFSCRQILTGHEFRSLKGQEGDLDVGACCGVPHEIGMMRRRVIPDQQLGRLRSHLAQLFDEGLGIGGPIPLAEDQAHHLASDDMERAQEHPGGIAAAHHHPRLLAYRLVANPAGRLPA